LVGFSALGTADEVVWSDCPGLTAGRADVLLRPTPTAAVRTTDAMEIWGGDILLKDVPVVDVVAAAQGAGTGQAQRVIRPASRPAAGVR
jgi:hypothetical protein